MHTCNPSTWEAEAGESTSRLAWTAHDICLKNIYILKTRLRMSLRGRINVWNLKMFFRKEEKRIFIIIIYYSFFVILGLELRAFTLSHSTSAIFVKGFLR
jgi:hypothetical protein